MRSCQRLQCGPQREITHPTSSILGSRASRAWCRVATASWPTAPARQHQHDSDEAGLRQPAQAQVGLSPPAIPSSPTQQATPRQAEPWPCTTQVLEDVVTMFHTLAQEYDYWVEEAWVTGTIPKELRGTYIRNGSGLQINNEHHQRHFMDGDGCVVSIAFPGDGAPPHFTNKYVRTKGFLDEQAAGKPLYRNAFTRGAADGGKLFNPLDLSFKNVANTGVLYWGGRLWALWEVGRPYELCPHTLATLGESSMDDQIAQRLAGHYRIVTQPDGSKRVILFGAQVSFSGMSLEFYEMDEEGTVVAKAQHKVAKGFDIMFVHDMLVTEHWYIIIMGPVQLDLQGFVTDYLQAKRSLAELLLYVKDKPSQVFLYPRPGVTPPPAAGPLREHTLLAPAFFCFHHVNAYERAGGAEVVIDTISWQNITFGVTQYTINQSYYHGGCRSELYRLVAHLPTSRLTTCQQLLRRTVEFPAYNMRGVTGQPYRYAYFTGDAVDHAVNWSPAQALLKVTLPVEAEEELQQAAASTSSLTGAANNIVSYSSSSSSSSSRAASRSASPARSTQAAATTTVTASTGHGTSNSRTHRRNSGNRSSSSSWNSSTSSSSSGGFLDRAASLEPGMAAAEGVVCEEWRPGQRCFPQEPMFVARPGATAEDDGWLITCVHNAETQRGDVAILDAQRISTGPVAVIHLPHALSFGLHGTWTPAYLGPDPHDPTVPRWREPNTIKQL